MNGSGKSEAGGRWAAWFVGVFVGIGVVVAVVGWVMLWTA